MPSNLLPDDTLGGGDLATGAPAANSNKYLDAMQRSVQAEQVQFDATANTAVGFNADRAAASRRVAGYLGRPVAAVDALPEDAERMAKVKKLGEDTADTPVVRRSYTGLDFAKLANDDSGTLSAIERGIRNFSDGGHYKKEASAVGNFMAEGAKQLAFGVPALGAAIYDVGAVPFDILSALTSWALPEDAMGRQAFRMRQTAQAARGAMEYFSETQDGNIMKGLMSGLRSASQNLLMLPLGIAAGPNAMAGAMATTVGGQAYTEAREKGMAPAGAATYAIPHAAFEYIFEKLPAAALVNDISKHTGLRQMLWHQVKTEVPGEQATTVLQDFNDWVRLNPEKTLKQFVQERPDAAVQTLVATLVGSGAQTTVVRGVQSALGGAAEREARANDAVQDAEAMRGLLMMAAESKYRPRDPAGMAALVDQISEDHTGTPKSVFIDANTLAETLQQSGVTDQQLDTLLPSARAQLADAMATGGTVEIPLGELMANVAGSGLEEKLLPHIRVTEDALSEDEAKHAGDLAEGYLNQDMKRVIEQSTESQALAASGEAVRDTVLAQLTQANRFTGDVNAAYATLVGNFYTTMAARQGVTPEELYAKLPLQVQGAQVGGQELNQESPAFKQWFGDSKAVNAEGKPLVVYHGTTGDFETFDRARAGEATGAANTKLGFFFTDRADVADTYGRMGGTEGQNTLPVFVSLQNPLQLTAKNMMEADKELLAQLTDEHDGAIIKVKTAMGNGGSQTVYMVREPGQVKSATGNNGEFDPTNPSILKQNGVPNDTTSSTDARGVRQSSRVRGGDGLLAEPSGQDQGTAGRDEDGSLRGLPRNVGGFTASYDANIGRVADAYMKAAGLPYTPPTTYATVDVERAKRIATAFEAMAHDPQNPEVKAAYAALVHETAAQYQAAIDAGLQVEFVSGEDPYHGNPREMTEDVRNNNHMWVFSTRDGFGTDATFDPVDNPLLAETEFEIGGQKALVNDLFRVVHDYFGHVKEGVGFRAGGEENAWRAHAAMYSPLAARAATTETRGQNSWLNYGPYGDTNRTAKVEETHFADQKIGLLPEWATTEGANDEPAPNKYQQTYLAGRDPSTLTADERAQYDAMGDASKPSRDDNFAAWFEGSKVVDADGKPLVVYHGTMFDFDEFSTSPEATIEGAAFFSVNPDVAGQFGISAMEASGDEESSPLTMPVYLSIKNPMKTDANEVMRDGLHSFDKMRAVVARARRKGHDGLYIRNVPEFDDMPPADQWAVFKPEQIKSATGNNGDFDPTNPSILAQATRGTFSPSKLTISLLENADLSTFLHETGHFFLEATTRMAADPAAPADIKQDMATVLEWFGVKDLATWQAMTLDQQREHHEQFAESFEQYLFEGKAPSKQMEALFARFRAWLTNVYKSLQQFMASYNTRLTPEVREVFDRMLATDEQIDEAERQQGYVPVFESLADSGMTIEQWEEYQATNTQATVDAMTDLQRRSLRDMRWSVNARGRELKRLQAEAKEKRTAVEAEVRAEVNAEPVYQAIDAIREERAPSAADKDALKDHRDRRAAAEERAAEDIKAALLATPDAQGLKGLKLANFVSKNKRRMALDVAGKMLEWDQANPKPQRVLTPLEADAMGERFGFSSGDEMLRAIAESFPKETTIEGITDQRMLERYGDLATEDGIKRAATEAVHNETRAKFLATELNAMSQALNPRQETGKEITATRTDKATGAVSKTKYRQTTNALVAAAKTFAAQLVARKKVRDLKPAQHAAAETRAGKRALEATAAGKAQEAIVAKRDQLLQFYAGRDTQSAVDEVERGVAYLKRVSNSETIDVDYKDQIDKLLERTDLRAISNKEIDRRASLRDWIETQTDMGIEPEIPPELLNEAQRISYKEMTVEQFRGLVDTVKQIEHLGRLKNKLLTAKDQREFTAARDMIVASIVDNAGDRVADTRTPNTVLGAKLVSLKKFWASHIKTATLARVMDGGKDGGPVWEYIIRTANAAGDKEIADRAKATRDLAALVAPVIAQGKMGGKGKFYPSIDRSVNREGALAMALNTGNNSNFQRLLGGEGWTAEQVQPVLDSLTAADWRFVQAVWDYFESYRPEIAAKERRVSGVEPKWIEAVSREVQTADGKTVKLRGGYYPVKYDPRASERAEANDDAELARQQIKGAYTSATTRRSFTKTRVDEVHERPLLYSLDGIYNGVQEVIHDLAWHEFLIDANRLVKDKGISSAMRQHYGPEAHQQFKSWLQDVAQGEQATRNAGESALSWVRQGVSISGLGLNVMSAIIQPLGITQSIVRVGPEYVGRGIAKYIASPLESTAEVYEKSSFMANRSLTRLRELAEVKAQVKGKTKARQALDGAAYYLMLKAQQTVDIPTWIGAYEKATVQGNGEDRAVALADQAVIDAQGAGTTKDQAAIERGGPALKLFTVFYSFFNTAMNLGVGQTMTSTSKAKLAADYLLLFVIPVILGEALKAAITPGDSGEWDDPKKIAKHLTGAEISYLLGLMVGVREVAGAVQVATGTNQYGSDYAGPAGVRPIADAYKLGKQANQGEMDNGLRKAIINTAGQLLRLPAAQINRSITGAMALHEGKTHNPAAIVFGYEEPHK